MSWVSVTRTMLRRGLLPCERIVLRRRKSRRANRRVLYGCNMQKAKRSYQKDISSFQGGNKSTNHPPKALGNSSEWEYDAASGYYYNLSKGYHYDPKSCLYYSSDIGKWITEEESLKSCKFSRWDAGQSSQSKDEGAGSKSKGGPALGVVVSSSLNQLRSVKGAAQSSIAVNKRKRENEKTKVISKEEAGALKAREAAKKRMEEREKPLMGLLLVLLTVWRRYVRPCFMITQHTCFVWH
ncbi:zinc finger protein ZOP1 [Iris pallida]|uniref:Zinc finger protein ZOP1 n=1 Tax=Iris pallida TaxID=29817 RepID=A0AAX6DTN7_IRIPA|nr:zinc finger protein ZOP1 [Iris pallida]